MDLDVTSHSGAADFKLGEWWVRPRRNELERGEACVRVEARSMGVLVCLGRYAPGVVSKERLIEEVWSDSPFVGDDVLSHAIWELRKALGDSARAPEYIKTVPRKGYCLIAEILRPQGSPLPLEGVRIDHYDLGREMGRGAMGVVYEAVDRRLGRPVAIKFLAAELTRDPEACARFEREARLAASLEHPNLATVHEVGETSQGHRYLVSALYRGGSLKERIAEGPMEVEEAVRLVRQLIAGLGAAHQREIVHRDIKPANLLLDEHGTLKICDFGIAKLVGGTDLTRTGAAVGTPAYKSPEQARGLAVDHRTDLWAVGVVFHELLTGKRPFVGDDDTTVAETILLREPGTLEGEREVPAHLRGIIVKALAKDPAERFQSAREMGEALGGPIAAPERVPEVRSWLRRRLAVVAMLLSLLFVVLLILWLLNSQRQATRNSPRLQGGWDPVALPSWESRQGLDHLSQGRNVWLQGHHRIDDVREHFETAHDLMPDSVTAREHLAVFLAERYSFSKSVEDRDRALEIIEEILVANPGSASARVAEAWIHIMEQRLEEGMRLALDAIGLEPECDRSGICDFAYLVLGETQWMKEEQDAAFETLERGIPEGGGLIRCRLKLAQLYAKKGEKINAELEYREVLELDGSQSTALNDLAILYLEWRRFVEAMELLKSVIEKTGDPYAMMNLGYARYQRRRWKESAEIYRQALEVLEARGEVMAEPYIALGDIALEQENGAEAREHYRQALEILDAKEQPGIKAASERAVLSAKLGNLEEAKREIQSLLALDRVDDFPDLLVFAAKIYALADDKETLLDLARQWKELGGQPARLLDDDPAFKRYREDEDYLGILEPGLVDDP